MPTLEAASVGGFLALSIADATAFGHPIDAIVNHAIDRAVRFDLNRRCSEENWEQRSQGGNWRNYCPRCAEDATLDLGLAGLNSGSEQANSDTEVAIEF